MIFDCVLLTYERDALAVRMAELASLELVHVILESDITLRYEKRNLLWPQIRDTPLFAPYRKRICYMQLTGHPSGLDPMALERWQRDQLPWAAVETGARPNDPVVVADADEIPSAEQLKQALLAPTACKLQTDYRELKADWRAPDAHQVVHQAYVARLDECVNAGNDLRQQRPPSLCISGGWHLSSMGGSENIARKLGSFSHPEADPDGRYSDLTWLDFCTREGRDLLDRFDLEPVERGPGLLPTCILEDDRFKHLLRETT